MALGGGWGVTLPIAARTLPSVKAPPLYQTAPHRATACYLYRESPVIMPEKLSEIFVART